MEHSRRVARPRKKGNHIEILRQALHRQEAGADDDNSVILSISYSRGLLGAAVYELESSAVSVLRDVAEDTDFHVIDQLFEQVKPTTVIIAKTMDIRMIRHICERCGVNPPTETEPNVAENSDGSQSHSDINGTASADSEDFSRCSSASPRGDDFMKENDACDELFSRNNDDNDEQEEEAAERVLEHPPNLKPLPSTFFSYSHCLKIVDDLFASESIDAQSASVIAKIRIDIDAHNMVRALGALVSYVEATRVGVEYEALQVRSRITGVTIFSLDDMVEIDKATLHALDVFPQLRKRSQSNLPKRSDNSNLSLFGICNRCRTTPGRMLLRNWFEHPTTNRAKLRLRQQAIDFFLQECNVDASRRIHKSLGKVRSVRMLLTRIQLSTAKAQHWKTFVDTLTSISEIGKTLKDHEVKLELISEFTDCFGDNILEIISVLQTIIDFPDSLAENRVVVRYGLDNELDQLKNEFRKLPFYLSRISREESVRLNAQCAIEYVPMLGYLLSVPLDFPVDTDPEMEVLFSTETILQVKNELVRKLDAELGDLKMEIVDRESAIVLRMTEQILSKARYVLGAARAAAHLDASISLAMAAKKFGWCRPVFVDDSVIEASDCFHPITRIVAQHFVCNAVESGGNMSRVKLFTGPNACGKSVYLKQVGVLAYLASVGSFVPASKARIGPIDRILTRMYTVDAVLDGLSTFARDLKQLDTALRRGNEFSLVIIDEFGKGTMTEVGLSLFASSLNHWIEKGTSCPHIFASSHFHALPNLIDVESSLLSFHTMEVLQRDNRLQYKFRMIEGSVNCSHAIYTASQMKMPDDVLRRASEVYETLKNGRPINAVKPVELKVEELNRHLTEKMGEILGDFLHWDVEGDIDGVLEHLEMNLFMEGETSMNDSELEEEPDEASNLEETPKEAQSSSSLTPGLSDSQQQHNSSKSVVDPDSVESLVETDEVTQRSQTSESRPPVADESELGSPEKQSREEGVLGNVTLMPEPVEMESSADTEKIARILSQALHEVSSSVFCSSQSLRSKDVSSNTLSEGCAAQARGQSANDFLDSLIEQCGNEEHIEKESDEKFVGQGDDSFVAERRALENSLQNNTFDVSSTSSSKEKSLSSILRKGDKSSSRSNLSVSFAFSEDMTIDKSPKGTKRIYRRTQTLVRKSKEGHRVHAPRILLSADGNKILGPLDDPESSDSPIRPVAMFGRRAMAIAASQRMRISTHHVGDGMRNEEDEDRFSVPGPSSEIVQSKRPRMM